MTDNYGMTGVATYTVSVTATRPATVSTRVPASPESAPADRDTATCPGGPRRPTRTRAGDGQYPTCANIARATRSSYTLTRADRGAKLRVVVIARNVAGGSFAVSAQVGPVR